NALGLMKLDMPNPHAIFLHDTPSKQFFARDTRALSHGCIRTQDAMKLAMILAKGLGGLSSEEAVEIANSRKYTR
ncbi:L,D-transpeptidase family protein, partial [Erythrobacter sp.]|uniref:L,D-transpeptidase family protein n=1 Tax=Erythrobacter sp. TaxID=1042 RepID=UPI00311F46C6